MAVSLLARCQLQQHGVQLHSVPGRQNVVTCGLIAPQWHVGRRPTPRLAPVRAVSGRADDVSLGWNCGFTSNYSLGQMLGKGSFGEVRQVGYYGMFLHGPVCCIALLVTAVMPPAA